jgi:hypothetical protein
VCTEFAHSAFQGTFGIIQGTSGIIQGTFGIIQGTFGIIQETFCIVQEKLKQQLHRHIPSFHVNPQLSLAKLIKIKNNNKSALPHIFFTRGGSEILHDKWWWPNRSLP